MTTLTIQVPVTWSYTPPQPNAGDWLLYWFDGDADYNDYDVHMRGDKKVLVNTGGGTKKVKALVIVTLYHSMKEIMLGDSHKLEPTTPMMLIYGEGSMYELARSRGLWEGPILAPWQRENMVKVTL